MDSFVINPEKCRRRWCHLRQCFHLCTPDVLIPCGWGIRAASAKTKFQNRLEINFISDQKILEAESYLLFPFALREEWRRLAILSVSTMFSTPYFCHAHLFTSTHKTVTGSVRIV